MDSRILTVIIPVYNLENHIGACIRSLQAQDYSDFNVIIIDDGSTDNSLAVSNEIAGDDCRFNIIHKENGGVSSARNLGLSLCTGKYVAFIDGDDIVSENYLSRLMEPLDHCILSMCMYEMIMDYSFRFNSECIPFNILEARECAKNLLEGKFPVCVCGGIFRRDLIGDLRFPEGIRNNEDKYFLYDFLLNHEDKDIAFTNQKMYGYYVREGSATQKGWNGNLDTVIMADQIHELTMEKEPEWKGQAQCNGINARLSILKEIIINAGKKVELDETYKILKREILSNPLPACAGLQMRMEYKALQTSDLMYKTLVYFYYKLFNEKARTRRNERKTIQ